MSKQLIEDSLAEWKYSSGKTLHAVEAFPSELWDFSPGGNFGTFAKQLRHVICCRGVFADGFVSGDVDFAKKHGFYAGPLTREALLLALQESTDNVGKVLVNLEGRNLTEYKSNYYGESMSFLEHFSALTSHEATHRGMWSLYAALAKKEI